MAYNEDQPRDERGRWSGGGSVGGMRTIEALRGVSGPATIHKMSGKMVTPDGPRLTSLDDADVVAARYLNTTRESTDKIKTPEREALRKQVEDRMYGKGAGLKEKEAWIVIGGPGTGKSSIAREAYVKPNQALEIDSDIAKGMKDDNGREMLPEYNTGSGADAVHEESSIMAANVLERAMKNGDNIVMPAVGKDLKLMEAKIGALYSAGYKVHVAYVDVKPQEGARRALSRWRNGIARNGHGRFVDPYYVLRVVGDKPRSTYAALKTHPGVTSLERWDNNGTSPRRVERIRGVAGRG